MKNMYNKIENLLKQDERLVSSENTLLKNEVVNYANHMDQKLLKLLLSDLEIKKIFFEEIDGIEVFDKQKFNWIINSREFLPDSYTIFSQNIGLIDSNNNFIKKNEDVTLSFPNKDCFLEFDSTREDENRKEIFFNETLAKNEIDVLTDNKVFVNAKRYTKNEETQLDTFDENDNLFIKGNNLLAMYSLLPRYKKRIKLMYWDILYNKDSDIVPYNDSFKHSSWLVMMKNRLEVAQKLLSDDGVICIQCDDNEHAYLKVLCDEIFGRENKLSTVTIKVKAPAGVGQESFIFDVNEYILFYSKTHNPKVNIVKVMNELKDNTFKQYSKILSINSEGKFVKKLSSERNGEFDLLEYSDFNYDNISQENKNANYYRDNIKCIVRTTNPQGGLMKKILPQIPSDGLFSISYKPSKGSKSDDKITYYFLNGDLVVWLYDSATIKDNKIFKLSKMTNLWDDIPFQGIANEGNVTLRAGKKPESLLKRILDLTTDKDDIVLDAFSGSGTTASTALKMGRKFIGIEQLDKHVELSLYRLKEVIKGETTGISKEVNWKGGGSFTYMELAKNNQNYIDKIINAPDKELSSIYDELSKSDFLNYRVDKEKLKSEKKEFNELDSDTQRKILLELLDKNLLYINYADIDDKTYKISDIDRKFNKSYYEKN